MRTTGATFFRNDISADASVPSAVVAAQESANLIKAFNEISDSEERQRCLAYVQAAALAAKGKRL
ncbi:hypothetical protein FV222_01060 [Methylobacterium sp. WL103]|uniref:hypothetical protein n=1 Tax=Methylobacterium sp. WL103 TaxID=2603891 RepID=UPI0011C6F5AA|nr:hypothetical protein [Methylobacterium sp. WL103]TXN08255.1 hypothetical protein FV222_01060 [Methylobacterium sp. WL103]